METHPRQGWIRRAVAGMRRRFLPVDDHLPEDQIGPTISEPELARRFVPAGYEYDAEMGGYWRRDHERGPEGGVTRATMYSERIMGGPSGPGLQR